MGERFFDFWQVDVFTDRPLTGNPLAVFPRAAGLSDEEMRAIAREMNLSETSFVVPPRTAMAQYRNRIFTPAGEIPFAGHPSLGAAYVAALEGLVPLPEGESVLTQEVQVGALPLTIRNEGGQIRNVVMTQGDPTMGARVTNTEPLVRALRARTRDLDAVKLRPQIASTGLPSLQVPLRSPEAVRRLDPDPHSLARVLAKYGPHTTCYVFAFGAEGADAHLHARCFAPLEGVAEDPATGSAAGACGVYLAAHRRLPAPSFVIEQGIEMGRPSRIEVSVEGDATTIGAVRVGGQVAPVARGSLRIPS